MSVETTPGREAMEQAPVVNQPAPEVRRVLSTEWTSSSACDPTNSLLFFPPDSLERKEDRLQREMLAKRICNACIVQSECLETALKKNETYGIWGGMTEDERRHLLRSIRRSRDY